MLGGTDCRSLLSRILRSWRGTKPEHERREKEPDYHSHIIYILVNLCTKSLDSDRKTKSQRKQIVQILDAFLERDKLKKAS